MNSQPPPIKHRIGIIDLIRLSLRVFKTKPLRTFLTILGMSVGIGTVLFLISLGYGLQYILIGRLVATEDSLITIEAFYPSETQINITGADLEKILGISEAEEISPIAEFSGEIKYGDSPGGLALVKIIRPNYFRLSGVIPEIGSTLREDEAGIVASSQGVRLTGLNPDPSALNKEFALKIFYQDEKENTVEEIMPLKPLVLKGIITDDFQPPTILVPEKLLSKQSPFYKKILVKAKNIDLIEELRDRLLADGFLISARIDLINQARKVMNVITITLGVFGITALIVSAIGMFNTMVVGFLERIYEVGIIKALGATDSDVRNLFLMESLLMGLLGGIGGILLGAGTGQFANFVLNIVAQRFGGKPFTLFITPLWFIAAILVLSALIGIISGFWPARRAAYLSPKEAFVKK